MTMTADDFVTIVRQGSDKLRVDRLVLDTGEHKFHGSGILHICNERFRLKMHLDEGEKLPQAHGGCFTKKDWWKLIGVIEYDLEFRCDTVTPAGSGSLFGTWRMFNLHPIYLIPSGWDAMSSRECFAHIAQFQKESGPGSEINEQEQTCVQNAQQEDISVRFEALLFEYPFFKPFSGRELKGEIEGFDFTLKKENDDADLCVSLESKKDYISPGEKEEFDMFYAFMAALAFTNGAHAWPYRIEHWRGGRKITDLVTAVNRLTRISHGPFTDNLAWHEGVISKKWNYQDILNKATAFFQANTILSKEIADILFLLREADASEVHSDITMIALCALFENLIQLLFRERDLKEKAKTKDGSFKDAALQAFVSSKLRLKAEISQQVWKLVRLIFKEENLDDQEPQEGDGFKLFTRAKNELQDKIDSQISSECEALNRMYRVVHGASTFSISEQFQAILDDLQFDPRWCSDIESAFAIWKTARNQLFHGKRRTTQSEEDSKQAILDQCQIAGAINVLVLKLIGYSGFMRSSTLEDKYR